MPPKITANKRQPLRDTTNEQAEVLDLTSGPDNKPTQDKSTSSKSSTNATIKSVAGTKRKSTDADPSDVDLDQIDVDGMVMDKSCNQVRAQIRKFLDSGEMKIGAFCDTIGVSNKSLNDFLRQSGPMKGSGSATYDSAWAYFKKREIAGLKMSSNKKAKTSDAAKKSTGGTKAGAGSMADDVSQIHLDGEEQCEVPVFDTCDEIRRKIGAHLRKDGVTAAQFCRDLTVQLYGSGKMTASQLTSFRSKKGPTAGAASNVFYAAYVLFEKIRLASNKPKSKHRNEMEEVWPLGFDLRSDSSTFFICAGNRRPYIDRLGKVTIM